MTTSDPNRDPQCPQQGRLAIRLDCRHYLGDRPCDQGCQGGCAHYEPMGTRILVIKLGALGDVIRTTALLPGLKDRHPVSHITWVSRGNGCRVLETHPLIDRTLEWTADTHCQLRSERFDLLINLDKEPPPAALTMQIRAADKCGIGLSPLGTVFPLNKEAHYYFALGLSDDLKFQHNRSSYQQLIYEAVGLPYDGQRYELHLTPHHRDWATAQLRDLGVRTGSDIVGLNTGAGTAFANKTWPPESFVTLGKNLAARDDCQVVLLGGHREAARNAHIAREIGDGVIDAGCGHSEMEFAALIERCTVILSGDTTALHMAVALRVPVVALFGPTCPQEIDLYGRGLKVVSNIACAPCYKQHCDLAPNCMDLIDVPHVERLLTRYFGRQAAVAQPSTSVPDPHG